MSQRAVRLRITGRVQGVGYRAWTVRRAIELGLRGWVRNLSDGSVEALVVGHPAAIEAMTAACGKGPPGARVREVIADAAEDDGSVEFQPRQTA